MSSGNRRGQGTNCEVHVHGNAFLANVRIFPASPSKSQPIGPEALRPGDSVRLEIASERGDRLAVQLGLVRWTTGDGVGIKVLLMEADDQRVIDEVAWSYARGEIAFLRWLRKRFLGNRLSQIQLLFIQGLQRQEMCVPEAA